MALSRGIFCGTILIRAAVPHCARSKPPIPPNRARTTLSVSNWRMIRPRVAPTAARTAISLPRTDARASNRLATFAFAISKTQTTAAKRTYNAVRTSPINCSRNGFKRTPKKEFDFGYCCSRFAAIVERSACAWPIVTPGFSRAIASIL